MSIQREMERVVLKYVPRPATFIDVGVGFKSEATSISTAAPGVRVIGIEPIEENLNRAKKAGVFDVLLHAAVAATPGELTLYHGATPPSGGVNASAHIKQGRSYSVPALTLDSIAEDYDIAGPAILWMDIEGFELEALKGARNLLSSGVVRAINLEVHDVPKTKEWCSKEDLDSFLTAYGYREVLRYNKHAKPPHWDSIYTKTGV